MSAALYLAIGGLAALVAALLLVRSVGGGARVGRLLAATPTVSIDEAIAIAAAGTSRYVRVTGRISSDEEFPDDMNRPLVFRRTRIEVQANDGSAGQAWTSILDEREAVPFGIETRSSYIAVNSASLEEGLVVIPRESVGSGADLPADLLEGIVRPAPGPDALARLTIHQLSAVEHATVCGVPLARAAGAELTSGLGRPLIVTTLDQPSAMRLLAAGHRGRIVGGAVLVGLGIGLLAAAVVALLMGF